MSSRKEGSLLSQELSLKRNLQTKRDVDNPYPSAQAIFQRVTEFQGEEEFSDLFKEDLIEATGIVACHHHHWLDTSTYLKALLHRGLKRKESKEKVDVNIETSMMFTSVIGVEVLNKVAIMNKEVNHSILESTGRNIIIFFVSNHFAPTFLLIVLSHISHACSTRIVRPLYMLFIHNMSFSFC